MARLPPPRLIVTFGSVEPAQRYADATLGGALDGAPTPVALIRPGPAARARRALVAFRAAALGLVLGVGGGLMVSVALIGLPFWLLWIGPPLAAVRALTLVLRRLRVTDKRVPSVVWISVIGFLGWTVAAFGWLGRFPKGTFLLPDPITGRLLLVVVAVAGVGGAAIAGRAARAWMRPAGAGPQAVAEFRNRLGSVPWRNTTSWLPQHGFTPAQLRPLAGPDVLGRLTPGWQPIPQPVWLPNSAPDGAPVANPWHRLRRARRRRLLATVLPAMQVLWKAHPGLVVAVEPAQELHLGPSGVLHRLDGPALVWADGSVEYHLHGVRVPRSPALGRWTVEEIHAVPNSEARRVMIEAIGWDEYLRGAQLELVGAVPDPGNAPHPLKLYELPMDVFGRLQLLVMVNGSPDRTGRSRRYAEFVPAGFDDPIEAAAWQYGIDAEAYRELQRRT